MAIMDPQHSDTLWPVSSGEVCGAVCGTHAHTHTQAYLVAARCSVCGPRLPPRQVRLPWCDQTAATTLWSSHNTLHGGEWTIKTRALAFHHRLFQTLLAHRWGRTLRRSTTEKGLLCAWSGCKHLILWSVCYLVFREVLYLCDFIDCDYVCVWSLSLWS